MNVSDTEASFLDLHLSISDGFVKNKFFDKRDDFDFDIVNFLHAHRPIILLISTPLGISIYKILVAGYGLAMRQKNHRPNFWLSFAFCLNVCNNNDQT